MAQWRIDKQQKVEQNSKTLYELGMIANVNGDPVTNANPFPVTLGGANITVSGNVNIISDVTVKNPDTDPVHIHLSEVGTTGILTTPYLPVGGNVVVTSGNVAVTGVVNVGNIPASQNVIVTSINSGNLSIYSGNVTVSGSVNVGNIPTTQNVFITNTILTANVTGVVNVGNIPASQNVVITNTLLTANVVGTVNVGNIPASQNVVITGGNVTTTFPNTQNVQVLSNTSNFVYTQQAPTWSQDALGKIRTSSTLNQDWYVPVVDDDTTFRWSQALNGTNSGSQFLANTSEIQMSSGNTASGYAYRQTYSKFKIIPGTSHTVYTTVNFTANNSETGVTRRSGMFDETNGIYWEQGGASANTLAIVVRRKIANGTIVEDRVYANTFSVDKLDGTGPSGFNIFSNGLDKYYTFWFDFIGGRTGRVRFGMGTPTGPQICHVQSYAAPGITTPFITDNSLPLRREIFNSSVKTVSPTFNMSGISFQAESPSSFNPSPTTAYNVNGYAPDSTLRPVMTIGLRAGHPFNSADIKPTEFNVVDINNQGKNATAATFLWSIVYNANVNGTYAYSGNNAVSNANTGRASQYWTWNASSTISGGLTVLSGITQSGSVTSAFDGLPGTYNIGADINGNPATLTLCVRQLAAGGATSSVVASWNFIEEL